MNAASLAGFALVSVALLAVVLNHCHARLALIELALNEGLPPGYEHHPTAPAGTVSSTEATRALPAGVHVFLSRNCHACQRLIDELDQVVLEIHAPLHLHYVDRPRPIAAIAAENLGAELHEHDDQTAQRVGADPLPFTIAVGQHDLTSRAVTPTVRQVLMAARDAGIRADTAGVRR